MTVRELVYMCLDEIKIHSDDSYFEEEHVSFLLEKYRAFLLKQRYSDIKKYVSDSNYQSLCLNLVETPAISGEVCEGVIYLRSEQKIPTPMNSATIRVSSLDFFSGEFTFVNKERFRYVGNNRFTKQFIYCTKGPDDYLYFKSKNAQFFHLEQVKLTGVFSDAKRAYELSCETEDKPCTWLDSDFPMESALVPPIIELTVKELLGAVYRPKDEDNNSRDDLSQVAMQSNN